MIERRGSRGRIVALFRHLPSLIENATHWLSVLRLKAVLIAQIVKYVTDVGLAAEGYAAEDSRLEQ